MKPKRLALLALLVGLAFLATGCEWMRWLRLLSMKKQFADLEHYVRVEETNGLTLRFIKPVVYADDLRLLMEDETTSTTNRNRLTWVWTYEKQSLVAGQNATNFNMSFAASFEDLKFTELFFPERFLALLPKPMILGMLRSVGQADVDMKHGNIKFKWAGTGKEKLVLPTKTQVTALLGPPFIVTESNLTRTFLYKYYQKTPSPESPADQLAWARFTFERDGDRMLSNEGGIGNMGWSMTVVPGQAEMRVTATLKSMSVEAVALTLPTQITDDYVGQYQDAAGKILSIGRDGEVFAVSWRDKKTGGWCAALPESTNVLFGLPSGEPRWTFLHDDRGAVTGLVSQVKAFGENFARVTGQLPPASPVVKIDTQLCQACVGTYKASWGGRVVIKPEGDHLAWQNPEVAAMLPLYPASETNFFFKLVDSPLTFVKNDKGAVTKFILHYNGHTADAEKLKNP